MRAAGARRRRRAGRPTRRRSTPTRSPRRSAFLGWLEDHNFTFLGYRDYELSERGRRAHARLGPRHRPRHPAPGRGREPSRGFEQLPPAVRARALEPVPAQPHQGQLALDGAPARRTSTTSASSASTTPGRGDRRAALPRPVHPHRLPREPARDPDAAPQGRRGARSGPAFPPDSHDEKALRRDPRDLPARRAVPDLRRRAVPDRHGHPAPGRAPARCGCSSARDTFDRFVSCLVFVPRDRFNTENRAPHRADPAPGLPARRSIDYTTRVSESVLVRLHYLAYVEPGELPRLRRARDRGADWWPPRAPGATTSRRR